jgi:tripartite-type tricarboxylate transporter receptor subunit TctC
MKKRIGFCLMGLLLFTWIILPVSTFAAAYYEGKVIKIISGHEAGGGYDKMARVLAKHLPKFIPGKPTIIVENMPGASSIIAANYVYMSKPDGLTLGSLDRGIGTAQLLKIEGLKFDLLKFAWIGSASTEGTILSIRTDLPYKTIADLQKAKDPIPLGHTGPSSTSFQYIALVGAYLGVPMKLVGYISSAPVMLAIERKEVDGRAGAYTSILPFIDRGLVHAVLRGKVAEKGMEKLPVDEDLCTDPMGKKMFSMRTAGDYMGRPYIAAPGTPPELLNQLRDAFAMVGKDPELREDAKKLSMEVEYVPADEVLKVLNNFLNQPPDAVKEFAKYVKF